MNLQQAINFFCPLFFYHSDEKFFPIDPNKYILQSGLKQGDNWLIPKWNSLSQFADFINTHDGDSQKDFTLAISGSENNPELKGSLVSPIYSHVFHPAGTRDYYVHYILFFSFNPGATVFPCFPATSIGEHQADMEHVTLHFISSENDTEDSVKLSRIFFSSHSGGEWRSFPDEVEIEVGGKPVVHVAKGSHGMYPYGKTYIRFCGLGNDYCEKGFQGYHEAIPLPKIDDGSLIFKWSFFRGDFGNGNVSGLPEKAWHHSVEE